MYTFLINTWNTLPESYQQRVYKNTLATVKHQIQQVENPTPAVVISIEAALVEYSTHLDYVSSKVALEEPEIDSTDPNVPIGNNCMHDELHSGRPGCNGDYEDEQDESNERDAIPTAGWQWWPMNEL